MEEVVVQREAVNPTLRRALDRLDLLANWERADRGNMRTDLLPAADLLERLGNPQRRFRSVHVTGTKGKGSVCALVEAGLSSAGWRVGRYASPHLQSINERVSIDRQPITDKDLSAALIAALDARDVACAERSDGARATWFDVMTAAAFLSFARANLEWVVVEVGLGGRLDSTNVIEPEVAVITNVGLEHTDVLGDTLEEIAAEKAGIVKQGVPVVTPISIASPEGRVIAEVARSRAAPLLHVPLAADAPISEQNLSTARAVLESLGRRGVTSHARSRPLGAMDLPVELACEVGLPGRMERFHVHSSALVRVPVVLDGAHVAFAVAEVLRELALQPEFRQAPVVLLAVGADKDADAIVSALVGHAAHVVCTRTAAARRGLDPGLLAALAKKDGLPADVVDDPMEGFSRCCEIAEGRWILVIGSLYLAGAVRRALTAI